jgi:hypothetical protein
MLVGLPDSISFINTADYTLLLEDFIADNDLPGDSLRWQFDSDPDSLEIVFNVESFELNLSAPGFSGNVTLVITVTDDSSASVVESILVSVDEEVNNIDKLAGGNIDTYKLFDNYPNPFNPSTKIRYQLPASSEVQLVIYNVLGQEARILVSERQAAGQYQVEWDASDFASGVYFYRLQTEGFVEIKKMILVK